MYYVYVLLSEKDGNFYTGYTLDLKRRMIEHHSGESRSTKHWRPLELVYYEASRCRLDAMRREKYLKTTYDHYINNRLSNDMNKEK